LVTKSKNNNEDQDKLSKKACVLIFAAMFFVLTGFFGISNISYIKSALTSETESYYNNAPASEVCEIPDVNYEALRYVKNLNRYYIYFKNFDSKTAYEKLKELQTKLTEESVVNFSDLSVENENAHKFAENESAHGDLTVESQYPYFEKAPESYYTNIDYTKLSTIEKLNIYKDLKEVYENYEMVKNYLKNEKSFQYKIENKITGKVYSNNDNIDKEDFYYKFSFDNSLFSSEKFNGEYLSTSFEQNNLNGYIIVPKNAYDTKTSVYVSIKNNEMMNKVFKYSNYVIPCLFLIAIFIVIYILTKEKKEVTKVIKRVYSKYRKIPFILKIIILFLSVSYFDSYVYAGIGYFSPGMGYYNIVTQFVYYNLDTIVNTIIFFMISIIVLILFILNLIFIIDMIRKPSRLKEEYELGLVYDIICDTKYLFNSRHYGLILVYIILITGTLISLFLLAIVLLCIGMFSPFHLIIIFVLEITGLITVYEIMKLIVTHCKLSCYIENIVNGVVENIEEKSKAFEKPFEGLKKINENINDKVEKMMKNERLKTELITNVSHDLKTPLTSIINYIDLLKAEKFDNDSAKEYISIIDGKADRLKVLIENLFEASKLSTNQFKLEISKSDIVALLKQTIGEFNNRIEESNLNFIIELPSNSIYLDIDGQQIWRVFDNLLNNIIKYSPKNSRVYISLEETETEVKIIMKNISKAPLNFDPEELFERFKRGDSSRSTEGSGLGLSIAKGIIEHHNGQIFINIDGDLFKIAIILKKP